MTETPADHSSTPAEAGVLDSGMCDAVLAGLREDPKYLPSHYLYDEQGARLFEQICELPEYYLTRTELQILREHLPEISRELGPRVVLVEPGSGSGQKSMLVLEALVDPVGFVPIDVSGSQLQDLAARVRDRFPGVEVHAECGDFRGDLELPAFSRAPERRVGFFPGTTLGNFGPEASVHVLEGLGAVVGEGGRVLLGLDLKKATGILEAAYDDSQGVSRDFALNYLVRLNREANGDFDLNTFGYEAPYDPERGTIVMSLVSLEKQVIRVCGAEVPLERGERIRTEFSYKFDLEQVRSLANRAGLDLLRTWTDPERLFGMFLLGTR